MAIDNENRVALCEKYLWSLLTYTQTIKEIQEEAGCTTTPYSADNNWDDLLSEEQTAMLCKLISEVARNSLAIFNISNNSEGVALPLGLDLAEIFVLTNISTEKEIANFVSDSLADTIPQAARFFNVKCLEHELTLVHDQSTTH